MIAQGTSHQRGVEVSERNQRAADWLKKKKKVRSGDVDGIHPTSERLNE